MPIRILIADDHGVLRAGLAAILNTEPDMQVAGEAGSGEEALRLAADLKPDLVLLDLSLPNMDGIEATQRFTELLPETRVLILTMHEDNGLAREAIRAGASGYILKRAVKTELISAIHIVMNGDVYIHPALMRSLLVDLKPEASPKESLAEPLTAREVEVLRLLAQGYTNQQIANMLSVSVRTVEYHRANLTDKLNLRSRVDLMRYAAEHGIE